MTYALSTDQKEKLEWAKEQELSGKFDDIGSIVRELREAGLTNEAIRQFGLWLLRTEPNEVLAELGF